MEFNIDVLTGLLEKHPEFTRLTKKINGTASLKQDVLILNAAKPLLISALVKKLKTPVFLITSSPENAKRLYDQIVQWTGPVEVSILPEPDTLPYQKTIPDPLIEQERLQILDSLLNWGEGDAIPVVVTSVSAVMQKIIDAKEYTLSTVLFKTGQKIELLKLISQCESLGYQMENLVEAPGTMSHRGGIVDIFPPATEYPVRIEFFGEEIESIRLFDPETQRSRGRLSEIAISPATDLISLEKRNKKLLPLLESLEISGCNEETREQIIQDIELLKSGQKSSSLNYYAGIFNTGNIIDFIPEETLVIIDDETQVRDEFKYLDKEYQELRAERISLGDLPANYPDPYFTLEDVYQLVSSFNIVRLYSWTGIDDSKMINLNFSSAPGYAGQLDTFISKSIDFKNQGNRILIVTNQSGRLAELFDDQEVLITPVKELPRMPDAGTISIIHGSLDEGWVFDNTYLYTDKEVFGFIKERRLFKKRPVTKHKQLVDIKPDDYVVHVEHGIAKFSGVITMGSGDTQKEYLLLLYADGDKLYVPTEQIDRLSRYIGSGETEPRLSRLGTQEWSRTKQKVKESVEEIAEDLLELYSARQVVNGYSYSDDTMWQRELEGSFPYIETPDQMKVLEEVKADMAETKPMDRLIVGDVGYGKTEIAIRAAFKAVMDNKQVAVLVPTTVLAEQHYQTFSQRMAPFPVKVEVLSRFRSAAKQQKIIEDLKAGNVDICIGTHRIIQKDVIFKDLGLLVIDEEQRFGVSHKEYLKKLRQQVDVLTLSATPIPRTLHMSLVGVRDMSLIETPPENRLPIKTYVAEFNDQLVKEAILKEIERNGQVFFVHNRVQGIAYIAEKIKKLVPEARVDIAHGQMKEDQLERVMMKFHDGDNNVLVCTTIIESGLDLPNANTLIVNHADKFGLTQLYQLRGRIGRGSNIAYSYFLYDRDRRLTPIAEKRLRTIYEATELGAGFGIAMKDLEIRGAGNLLGTRQSGNISAVGFSLYTDLLAQAVEEKKNKLAGQKQPVKKVSPPEPSVDLPLKSYLPESFIRETDMRLSVYKRISMIETQEQADDLTLELKDRFGELPGEALNLLYTIKVKIAAKYAHIESITTNDKTITLKFLPGIQIDRQKILPFHKYGIRIGYTQVILNTARTGEKWPEVLLSIINTIFS